MKDLTQEEWGRLSSAAAKKFAEALGKEHVKVNEHGIELTFSIAGNLGGFNVSERLGQLAAQYNLQLHAKAEQTPDAPVITNLADTGGDLHVTMAIPREQRNIGNVVLVADSLLAYKKSLKDLDVPSGEKHIPIVAGEPEHALERLTGVKWQRVVGSPYEGKVVEAMVKPQDGKVRAKQEHAVGYVLQEEPYGAAHVKEWLEHQERVEKKAEIHQPRTLLPADWVNRTALARIESADPEVKKGMPKVFSGPK